MGNRANVVVVKDEDWQLYYSHWAGCRMLDILIGGPSLAERYANSLRRCAKNEWTDAIWSDGGAVVDLDRKRVLFFGDELMYEMQERRAVLAVLAAVWPDYQIGWAYDGTVELAAYVGAELRPDGSDPKPPTEIARNKDAQCNVVSVARADGTLAIWPLGWDVSQAWHGPGLLEGLPGRGAKRLALRRIPDGGVHIDVSRKTLGVWQIADALGIFQSLPEIWSGWQTECWEDRYEEQVAACGGALRVPELDLVAGIESAETWLRKRVFQSFEESPDGLIVKLATMLDPLQPGMVVSSDAVTDCGSRPTDQEWARFTAACADLRGRYAKSA